VSLNEVLEIIRFIWPEQMVVPRPAWAFNFDEPFMGWRMNSKGSSVIFCSTSSSWPQLRQRIS